MSENNYESQIDSLIAQMTLEEKVNMIHASSAFTSGGVERLGIPEIVMSDGPHGVRHEHGRDWKVDSTNNSDLVSYLPTGIALAATWNRELGYEFGGVLGSEAKARGKDIILGPGVNIIRSPLNGRNFEYLSEDPYLTSEMAVGYIKGVQDQGIAACVKHFVANNQETLRNEVDVIVDERALQEIYLPAFKASVQKGDVYTVMGAYNLLRGQHCSHHDYLINTILKGEWGFTGALISDWGAIWDTREALLYGTDIEMGTELRMDEDKRFYNKFYMGDAAIEMIKSGAVPESVIDDKVRRVLRVMFNTNMFDTREPGQVNTPEHQELARQVADEAVVLLKNDNLLPFDQSQLKTIAVIGVNADFKHAEFGGSSQVKALYEVTPLQGIKDLAGDEINVVYAQGYDANKEDTTHGQLALEAVEVAKNADAVIFVGGWLHNFDNSKWGAFAYDCEGKDKEDIKLLFGQEELIKQLADVNPNIAVVLFGGGPVEMKGWLDKVPAYLHAWYPGMEGGNAIAEILFGDVNPSGKLPMSFANSHLDYPSHSIGEYPGKDSVVHYKEGIMIGYRYFASADVKPLFAFGHGLSYTSFEFSNLEVEQIGEEFHISIDVENTGDLNGAETAQCYISKDESDYERPAIELKGFEKKMISAGDIQTFEIVIDKSSLMIYDEEKSGWVLEPGTYTLKVGNASDNILLEKEIVI